MPKDANRTTVTAKEHVLLVTKPPPPQFYIADRPTRSDHWRKQAWVLRPRTSSDWCGSSANRQHPLWQQPLSQGEKKNAAAALFAAKKTFRSRSFSTPTGVYTNNSVTGATLFMAFSSQLRRLVRLEFPAIFEVGVRDRLLQGFFCRLACVGDLLH